MSRSGVSIALTALLVPVMAQANSRDEAIEALITSVPEIARIEAGTVDYVLRGDLSKRRRAKVVKVAAMVVADLDRRLILRPSNGTVTLIDVCLFETNDAYVRFDRGLYGPGGGPSPLGYYEPNWEVVVGNVTRGMGNLRHELVHPLLGRDFPGLPSWLNEGFGSLYGTARSNRQKQFHFLVNYRLRDLQRALDQGTLPTLEQVVSSSRVEVYGDRAMVYYALSRYLLLYMDRRGTLGEFYRAVRSARGDPDDILAELRERIDYQAFRDWARDLQYPTRSAKKVRPTL